MEAVGYEESQEDYGYVHIMYAWHKTGTWDIDCKVIDVMWADECVYGTTVHGSKVGDFIQTWLEGAEYGIFTHRTIAQKLINEFSGLKIKELQWFENPYEKVLKSGKSRIKRPKWLPDEQPDLVYLYSDVRIDVNAPSEIKTDFFVLHRTIPNDVANSGSWFMCSKQTAQRLKKLSYTNIEFRESTIVDSQTAIERNLA